MSDTSYTVTDSVCQVFVSGPGGTLVVYNAGTEIVYASKDAVQGTGGFPIEPTGNLHWDGTRSLFLTCPTGTSTVYVAQSVEEVTPLQSMATNIGNAITGGAPITNDGIANAIYNKGVTYKDQPVVLESRFLTFDGTVGAQLAPSTGDTLDVGAYSSLYVSIDTSSSIAISTETFRVWVYWCVEADGSPEISFDVLECAADPGTLTARLAVKAPYCRIYASGDLSGGTQSLTLKVLGSYTVNASETIYCTTPSPSNVIAPYDGTSKIVRMSALCPASSTTTFSFHSHAGRATYSASMSTSATLAYSASIYTLSGTLIHYFNKAAGDYRLDPVEIILPAAPLIVRVTLGAEAASRQFGATLIMDGRY